MMLRKLTVMATLLGCFISTPGFAWGDKGHEVVGLIALHYLQPAVRARVIDMLKADRSGLTINTDIDKEATWADKYRDSDRSSTQVRYNQTHNWHYVDLELSGPDLKADCFGQPPLNDVAASAGPANDCIVDKIDEFAAELHATGTSPEERLLALQFLLHFVGDLHQPLHASDDHDQGGNAEQVRAPGLPNKAGKRKGNLHGFWDTQFVNLQGGREQAIAKRLIAHITEQQRRSWSAGNASEWAKESFGIGKAQVFGRLPTPDAPHQYTLPPSYLTNARDVVATQLSKAGVRLAFVLNNALQ